MKTPILFILFKRYDTAIKVFNAIRKARPPRLYVAADAPREDVSGEAEECLKTRNIINHVDWECEVYTLFQTENQGCGIGPFKAISWFFENEESGIILEDDCLPHPDFFGYCEEMLVRYKDDDRIGLITGRCNYDLIPTGEASYFLSAFHFCWGWASWRRVWKNYDYTLRKYTAKEYFNSLRRYFTLKNFGTILWRMNIYYYCKKNQPRDIWDYQFCISTQCSHQFTIVPKANLVRNIGFDERATHTGGGEDCREVSSIMPIKHMGLLEYNSKFDSEYSRRKFKISGTIYNFIKNILCT